MATVNEVSDDDLLGGCEVDDDDLGGGCEVKDDDLLGGCEVSDDDLLGICEVKDVPSEGFGKSFVVGTSEDAGAAVGCERTKRQA